MIEFEPFAGSHLGLLDPILVDPDVLRFTRIPVPVPAGFGRAWLDAYEEGRRKKTKEAFAILEDGVFLGLVMAPTIDRAARTAELGYVVMPAARGRGIATGALGFMTGWALAEGMERLELLIGVGNHGSKRVAERCGYTREGVLRSRYFKQGIREDTEIWSRLAAD